MGIHIDAWLERKEPQVRFTARGTGEVLLHLGSIEVRQLLEAGDLSPEELAESSISNAELYLQLQERLSELHPACQLQKGATSARMAGTDDV